ncbi:MAG: N-acetylglucosaminyl-diphospho-decaprenol L-rhamnosyltransferase [Thermoanaerobaculia bacterium]|jgi:GT2 family glycosyltransferase|nr:N-acetylglucosaminyl-diphospho-decaprenol L-rhamnosyltransferase [Thermoanaerobaculia bacterium]
MAETTRKLSDVPKPMLRGVATGPLDLSIAIVTWNSERWIERCLQSIRSACGRLAYEVVVYDNASSDATIATMGNDVEVIRGAANDGFAAGVNRVATRTSGRYLFLLNPDCELSPRALEILVGFLDENPAIAAAAPLLSDEAGDSQREFQLRRLPTLATLISEVFGIDKLFPRNPMTARYRYRELELTHPQPVEQPAAAALLLRREVFSEVGPLDERFAPAWFEDVDYCRRLAEAGKTIFVVPAARARHFGGASLEHVPFAEFIALWYRNMWFYARKWHSHGAAEALRWAIVFGMLLRIPLALAGIANRRLGRLLAARAYAGVMRKAFTRWSGV